MKRIVLSTLSLLVSSQLLASNYYVTTDGYGSVCDKKQPCASIQAAINVASEGDTIKLKEGTYIENITIPVGKNGLTIKGEGAESTIIKSDGGDVNPKFAPPGVPVDIIIDIFSANVTIKKISTLHPEGSSLKRDVGIFVRPPAANFTITKSIVERLRTGDNVEPFVPGSRGILVLRASDATISKNYVTGNYQDHLHLPASNMTISKNKIDGASRIGIAIIQENAPQLSNNNIIRKNKVSNSGVDGIQIQGDFNYISKNELKNNVNAGIKLCGASDCVAPGVAAVASGNIVSENDFDDNGFAGLINDGTDNIIKQD